MQYWAFRNVIQEQNKILPTFFNGERQYLTINFLQMRIYVNP